MNIVDRSVLKRSSTYLSVGTTARTTTTNSSAHCQQDTTTMLSQSRQLLLGPRLRRRWATNLAETVPPTVQIVEVGPRDGLQNEKQVTVAVQDKVKLVEMLIAAGCTRIEAGSFVSSKAVPAMADSPQVMEQLNVLLRRQQHSEAAAAAAAAASNLKLSCLVPNVKYLRQALTYQPDEIAIFASASETFSQKNINCSIDESLERFRGMMKVLQEHNNDTANNGNSILVRGYVSCVLGCPYEGVVATQQVARVTEQLLELGCHEVSLGDTIGVGNPASTARMLDAVLAVTGNETSKLAVHFHDTYGQALVNILTSLERGIATIDASVAGLGGCPYAQGATGNVATEDVVYMLDGMGVATGIDLDRLVEAGEFISRTVLERPSDSKAGTAIANKNRRKKDDEARR